MNKVFPPQASRISVGCLSTPPHARSSRTPPSLQARKALLPALASLSIVAACGEGEAAQTAETTSAVVSPSLETALECVEGYVYEGQCDWAHWSELYEVCGTYAHPELDDGYLLGEVKEGRCNGQTWPGMRAHIVQGASGCTPEPEPPVIANLTEAIACVHDRYVAVGHCDWAHWSELYEVCHTYEYPQLDDDYLLTEVKEGRCNGETWPAIVEHVTGGGACAGSEPHFYDLDDDGYGAGEPVQVCPLPEGVVTRAGDCDDTRPDVRPHESDVPDTRALDANCDGMDGDAAALVFASPSGNDGAEGTREAPVRSIERALSLAASRPLPSGVALAKGDYQGTIALRDGVSLYGGYDGSNWSRKEDNLTRVLTGTIGVAARGLRTGATLQWLTIEVPNASGFGESTYGVHAVDAQGLVLEQVVIRVGRGGNGSPGASGFNGQNGGRGGDGSTSRAGGGGGFSACAWGGAGGNGGGSRAWCGERGEFGASGGSTGCAIGGYGGAGGACGRHFGDDGGAGGSCSAHGGTGGLGASASMVGSLASSGFWQPVSGLPGAPGGNGMAGAGGGGGGGPVTSPDPSGSGGGGGGGAGCGGGGGAGGGGAGGSFGLFLVRSSLQYDGIYVITSLGGQGGNGGLGGSGGFGGTGGSGGPRDGSFPPGGAGGAGGSGSNAGAGGGGGGGAGGASVARFLCDTGVVGPLRERDTSGFTVSAGGPGGQGRTGQAVTGPSAVEMRCQ